jgi:putative endonuclease
MSFYVYILASRRNGTLYTGMTDDLVRRVWQHRTGAVPGFTSEYGVKLLVWYEQHETRASAFARERQIKKWNRSCEIAAHRESESRVARLWEDISTWQNWVPASAGTNGECCSVIVTIQLSKSPVRLGVSCK